MTQIEAIIFDKDGTLFEFENTWMAYCDQMLEEIAGDDTLLRNQLATFCGYEPDKRRFVPDAIIIGGSLSAICSGWAALSGQFDHAAMSKLSASVIAELRPEPICELQELLSSLRKDGMHLGLVTNDLEAAAKAQLYSQGVNASFDFICGCDSGYSPKPDPEALLAFCHSIGLSPSKIAVVGDSLHDLHAAKSMGAGLAIGVLTGPAGRTELTPYADYVLESVADLPSFLNGSEDCVVSDGPPSQFKEFSEP